MDAALEHELRERLGGEEHALRPLARRVVLRADELEELVHVDAAAEVWVEAQHEAVLLGLREVLVDALEHEPEVVHRQAVGVVHHAAPPSMLRQGLGQCAVAAPHVVRGARAQEHAPQPLDVPPLDAGVRRLELVPPLQLLLQMERRLLELELGLRHEADEVGALDGGRDGRRDGAARDLRAREAAEE